MFRCPWCGGETREGEAIIQTATDGRALPFFGMMRMQRFGLLGSEAMGDQKISWREKVETGTGRVRRQEEKTMKISARRCIICGHIEFYARDSTQNKIPRS